MRSEAHLSLTEKKGHVYASQEPEMEAVLLFFFLSFSFLRWSVEPSSPSEPLFSHHPCGFEYRRNPLVTYWPFSLSCAQIYGLIGPQVHLD